MRWGLFAIVCFAAAGGAAWAMGVATDDLWKATCYFAVWGLCIEGVLGTIGWLLLERGRG